jgi:hypothetical protein
MMALPRTRDFSADNLANTPNNNLKAALWNVMALVFFGAEQTIDPCWKTIHGPD